MHLFESYQRNTNTNIVKKDKIEQKFLLMCSITLSYFQKRFITTQKDLIL